MAFDDDDRRSHDPEHNPGARVPISTEQDLLMRGSTLAPSEAAMRRINDQAIELGHAPPFPVQLEMDRREKEAHAAKVSRDIDKAIEEVAMSGRPPIEPEAYEFVMGMIQENIAKAFMVRGLDQADKKGGGSVQWDVDLGRGVSLTVDVFFNPVGTVTDIHPVGFRVNADQNTDLNTGTVTDMLLTLTGLTVEVYRD